MNLTPFAPHDLRPGGNERRILTYDALDRMITAHGPELLGFEYYGYDALDNLRSASFTGSARDDLHITWQMNAANRLASIYLTGHSHHYSHDARGNHTSGLSTALVPYTRSFNARNQLTSVNLPGQVDVYRYDGHGRRTSIQRNGQTTTQLYSRDGQLLYERSPNGQVTRHIHLGGRLVASVVGGITTYQHTDHLGSPIRRTNTAGTLTGMTIYAPYGSVVAGTVGQGPGFTGHVNDTGSGLVYMQQRHYDPIAMRFVSADPVHVDTSTGSNFNRYWYANNNPYKYVDPDGRQGCTDQVSQGLEGPCVQANTFSNENSRPTDAIASRAVDNAASQFTRSYNINKTDEQVARIDITQNESGEETGTTSPIATSNSSPVGAEFEAAAIAGANGVIHSHPTTANTIAPGEGDSSIPEMGIPSYIAHGRNAIVIEISGGQYRARSIRGRLSNHERKLIIERLDDFQGR